LKEKYKDEYLHHYERFKEKKKHILEIAENIKSESILRGFFERMLLEEKEKFKPSEEYLINFL